MNARPETPEAAARRLARSKIAQGYTLAALHAYPDATGTPIYYRIRCTHPKREKWVRPMHHDGTAFVLSEPAHTAAGKPLYRLPDVIASAPDGLVYAVEGEACADALATLGIVATTTGGAGTADAADWSPLAGRRVVIWPDHDTAGTTYAAAVTARLRGIAASVEWIDRTPLDLPEQGDCVDWLALHPQATADDVYALARMPAPDPSPPSVSRNAAARVTLRAACDVEPQPVDWLWPGWIATGKLHLIGGAPGTGKTTVAVGLAAIVSAGGQWPGGGRAQAGSVVIWSGEDDDADTLNPRLRAAGADTARVRTVGRVVEGGESYPFDPARDLDILRDAMRTLPDVRLLVIDPVVSAVSGDSHKNAEVRRGLQPLVDLARDLGCAVVGITHFSKGTSGRDPVERITGSLAFGALARVVMVTAKQGEDDSRRVLLRAKCNIGPDSGGFAYDLRQEPLPGFPCIEASRVVWGEAIDGTARQVLADAEGMNGDRSATAEAVEWLRAALATGPRPAGELKSEAAQAGIEDKPLRTARERLGVKPQKVGFDGGWVWALPKMPEQPEGATPDGMASSGGMGIFASDAGGDVER